MLRIGVPRTRAVKGLFDGERSGASQEAKNPLRVRRPTSSRMLSIRGGGLLDRSAQLVADTARSHLAIPSPTAYRPHALGTVDHCWCHQAAGKSRRCTAPVEPSRTARPYAIGATLSVHLTYLAVWGSPGSRRRCIRQLTWCSVSAISAVWPSKHKGTDDGSTGG